MYGYVSRVTILDEIYGPPRWSIYQMINHEWSFDNNYKLRWKRWNHKFPAKVRQIIITRWKKFVSV